MVFVPVLEANFGHYFYDLVEALATDFVTETVEDIEEDIENYLIAANNNPDTRMILRNTLEDVCTARLMAPELNF
jgi:hypothetical protein